MMMLSHHTNYTDGWMDEWMAEEGIVSMKRNKDWGK
jgi:hypothetical protein